MALWLAALLGIVQGLTEFIPVSSTAHLRVVPALLGEEDPGAAYTAVLQLGTLLAVLAYFARDLVGLTTLFIKEPSSPEGRLPLLIAAGTVPIVIAGLLLKKQIETDLRSLYVIASTLIGIGLVMVLVERYTAGRDVHRPLAALTYGDAILIGLAQALALVPGVSRSGATICMALMLGFTRSDAARYSFLLSIPAIAGAGILEARSAFRGLGADAVPALLVGLTTAAVSGYLSIAWLINWLGAHDLIGFAIYRIVVGLGLLAALLGGFL